LIPTILSAIFAGDASAGTRQQQISEVLGGMTWRDSVKKIVPGTVIDLARGRRPVTYDEAFGRSSGYTDDLLTRFRVERERGRQPKGETGLLGQVVRELGPGPIEVTDFGGAAGELARDLVAAFPNVQCTVVENATMAALARTTPGVRFSAEIPPACDVFHSSCALFYVTQPMEQLELGFRSARRAVVLVRNCFCDTKLYRIQKSWLFDNGSGPIPAGFTNMRISYPHQTLNEGEILALAERLGFRCTLRQDDDDGVLPWRGMVYGRKLVFTR
jgi:hypothetical protein